MDNFINYFIKLVMVFSPIGLLWTTCLNFQFRLLATEVEKTVRRMDVLIEVFTPQKTQRATGHLSPPKNNVRDLKSLFSCYHGKLVSLFI